MGSLSELLSKEGFVPHNSNSKSSSNKKNGRHNRTVAASDHDSISLPIYICHNRKSFEQPKHKKNSSIVSSKGRSSSLSNEPAIDAVATRAVISILSAYAGKYIKDEDFRDSLREKCCSCLVRRSNGLSDNGIFENMELGIKSIEKLIDNPGTVKELRMKSLRNSIGFLTIVASLNSKESRNGTTCGTPNSYLSACAQLYLSIVYKLEKNDRICARHVLQVFVDSPQLARIHLLPDLWDHFFLPHLLHLKIWFNKQLETVSDDYSKDQENVKHLTKAYEDHMDMGTVKFALYYKEWLKTGGQPPANLPSVPLPSSNLSSPSSTRRPRSSSFNNYLHRAIFGNPVEKQPSIEFDFVAMEQTEDEVCLDDYNDDQQSNVESSPADLRKSSSLTSSQPDYTRFLPCQSLQTEPQVMKSRVVTFTSSSDLTQAISTISSSQSLPECEKAIRVITKAWLDDPSIERTLSKPPVIEGMLEVLFASNNEEILELVISLLTEFVTRYESTGRIILNIDPQLEGFMNLIRNSSLFLKAATLLHLVKPEAKQMLSIEWIPLVLRVLEFGDQTQTLFSVRCSPQVAAYYFLDQLLTRFHQDRNLENGRQVISLGGLSLLLRRMAIGDILEKTRAVSVIYCCILADGRCRHYLANNLNPERILELLVHAKELDCNEIVVSLLVELICLNRFEQRIKLFDKLLKGWDCFNTMQILLVCLQRTTREKRPFVAAIMLQLDLMGDPLKSSIYREEAIEAIYEAFDHQICNENVQEQAAKSLLILGGRYAYNGTLEVDKWILKEAGFDESLEGGFHGRYHVTEGSKRVNEDDEIEHWQRKAAMALWISGGERLIGALGEAIANGIPCLARASLVTVAWMSKFVHTAGDGDILQSVEFSTLIRRLLESLYRDNAIEERVLASFALLALSESSDFLFEILDDEKKEMMVHLRNISKVTWTAKRLASTIAGSASRRHPGL